ncbi:MAG: HAMP domain-containing protein [Planctomycetota bacterium]|nr:MAG: HAMP domain-containing protein [Planctomycetota bacterium]
MRGVSLPARVSLAFALLALLVGAAALFVHAAAKDVEETFARLTRESLPALGRLEALHREGDLLALEAERLGDPKGRGGEERVARLREAGARLRAAFANHRSLRPNGATPAAEEDALAGALEELVSAAESLARVRARHPLPAPLPPEWSTAQKRLLRAAAAYDRAIHAALAAERGRVRTRRAAVEGRVRAHATTLLGGLLLVGALALGLGLATVRRLRFGLGQLEHAAERLGAGDPAARTGLDARDEVGRAGAAFDGMAGRIAGRQAVLEREVAERTSALAEAERELLQQERMAVLGRLLATVSHEIRNPLAAIGNSYHLLEATVRGHDEAADRALDRIGRSIARCDRIIEELLDFTRERPLAPREQPLDPWVDEFLATLDVPPSVELVRERGVPEPVRFDTLRLGQALANLVQNALQVLETEGDGGGRVFVRTRRTADRIELAVADTGPGIAPELRETVFEPLFSTKTYGVGLGLAIVARALHDQGGDVELTDEPGGGACFTLWLPLPEDAGASRAARTRQRRSSRAKGLGIRLSSASSAALTVDSGA